SLSASYRMSRYSAFFIESRLRDSIDRQLASSFSEPHNIVSQPAEFFFVLTPRWPGLFESGELHLGFSQLRLRILSRTGANGDLNRTTRAENHQRGVVVRVYGRSRFDHIKSSRIPAVVYTAGFDATFGTFPKRVFADDYRTGKLDR